MIPNPRSYNNAFEELMICLLRGVVEHTEADEGYLFLELSDQLRLSACMHHEHGLNREPDTLLSDLPMALIEHCYRTKILTGHEVPDAWPAAEGPAPTAWLCQPLVVFRHPIGILYLKGENALTLTAELAVHYFETANLRVARTRETEALQRDRERLEVLVQDRTRALEEAQQELVRKERLATLGQLIATVSHELRNPLGTVRGSVFLIANKLLGKDLGVERALDRAERNIVRCDRIIEDLLAYTRTHDLELEPVRIDRWLDNTLEEYPFPHDLTVRLDLNSKAEVEAEPERLRRCLINLLNNACDAMKAGSSEEEDGSKQLSITSRIDATQTRLEIAVADTGPGIPAEELTKVLEPLYSTKSFGVGLGLPTVVQVLGQHGGGLEVQSTVGVGTVMTMWMPLDDKVRRHRSRGADISGL